MNHYRPRLEVLAYELKQTRNEVNRLNANATDLAGEVKEEMHSAGLKEYEGQMVRVALAMIPSYRVIPEVALRYFDLETLLEAGAIEVNKTKFEKHLKGTGVKIDQCEYLAATGSHERVNADLKE